MKILKKILLSLLVVVGLFILFILLQSPSLDRDWNIDQNILAKITFAGDSVEIKDIRNFNYSSEDEYEIRYYNKTYILDEIESVYYIIEPFSEHDGPAHTMLSFGFEDGSYLAVSAEIRKEKGESFGPFYGLINKYEIVYMLGDENDLVKLRANYRKDDVYLYPIKTTDKKLKELFISVLKRADELSKKPEFYNTLTNTCTTSIQEHVNFVRGNNNQSLINWSKLIFLPSHSDKIAFDLGLIDTEMNLEDAREYYKINDLSEKYGEDEDYSKLIRKVIK